MRGFNIRILTVVGLLLFSVSLFAQRKKKEEKPSAMQKAYHNVTHQYNGYFNADLKVDEAKRTLTGQYQENYNQVLPMYKYLAIPDRQSSASNLDVAIKKAAIAISLHRISHWTDDSYLLIGQAQFIKGDYDGAESAFKYIISELDPAKLKAEEKKGKKKKAEPKKKEEEKKKGGLRKVKRPRDKFGNIIETEEVKEEVVVEEVKTEKGKPQSYFLKHRPVYKDALLWLAKTQIERDRYDEAFVLLNRLRSDATIQKSLKAEVEATTAYALLKRKNYDAAIDPLVKAISLTGNRKEKTRFTYILAQLYQMNDQHQKAYATFERVLKLRPVYEMEFNARLAIAKNLWKNGDGSIDDAERALRRMLKDEKNEEYLDQIYYALADIELQRDNRKIAIDYLKKSVAMNIGNKPQKAESYYLLAELFYQTEVYTKAKYYYDSTLTVLAKNDERQPRVKRLSTNLTEIAKNIEIIELQDSLLRIMNMSEDERFALALKIKETQKQERADIAKAKKGFGRSNLRASAVSSSVGRTGANTPNIGLFFAYDEEALRKGKRDFQKKWGSDRTLTDNWRRSNRKTIGEETASIETETTDFIELTAAEVKDLFKRMGVPQNDNEAKAANDKIMEAMAKLGTLYRDRLKNDPKAIEVLEELMRRYPDNPYKLESLYLLYVLHSAVPNLAKAELYKNQLIAADPNSKYAKAITDPSFLNKETDKQAKIAAYYDEVYKVFKAGNYKEALGKLDKADELFGKAYPMKPKFALLAAMCIGNLNGKDAYKIALNDVVKNYPDTEEKVKAAELLKYLNVKDAKTEPKKPKVTSGSKSNDFALDDNSTHFFAAVYDPEKISRDDITTHFSDFNKKYYRLNRLRTNSIYLNLKTPLLIIKRFKDKQEAMQYYTSVVAGMKEFFNTDAVGFVPLVMTQENYKNLVRSKDIEGYKLFFEENYK